MLCVAHVGVVIFHDISYLDTDSLVAFLRQTVCRLFPRRWRRKNTVLKMRHGTNKFPNYGAFPVLLRIRKCLEDFRGAIRPKMDTAKPLNSLSGFFFRHGSKPKEKGDAEENMGSILLFQNCPSPFTHTRIEAHSIT